MRVLVLGAGAIGGYFGGRLVEAGADVTFLVRERRAAELARDGLRIVSPYGDATVRVKTILAGALTPSFDAIFLTCKAYDLESAIEAVQPALAGTGVVLPLLNGLAHLERLNAAFGRERVLGGAARIQATLLPDGAIQQFNDWGTIIFGEQDGTMTERVAALAAAFRGTRGVEAKPVADIMQQLWEKLVHLATAASLTCLMRASTGEIAGVPEGAALFLELLETNAEIAAKNGHPPSSAFMKSWRKTYSDASGGYMTSMVRDIERGNRTEVEHVIGFMLREARRHGIDDRTLRLAYIHVNAYEARRAAGRLPG